MKGVDGESDGLVDGGVALGSARSGDDDFVDDGVHGVDDHFGPEPDVTVCQAEPAEMPHELVDHALLHGPKQLGV